MPKVYRKGTEPSTIFTKLTSLFPFLSLLALLPAPSWAQQDRFTTLTYYEKDELKLELDLFLPQQATVGKQPLLIFLHGGGFSSGSRNMGHALCQHLARNGIAAASISYTLYMQGKSFSCDGVLSEKVKAIQIATNQLWLATSFFLDRADTYSIDPAQIFIAGSSAGAEAVLHAAYWDRSQMRLYGKALPGRFRYAGIISGAGAMLDLNLIQKDRMLPTMLFHGSADPTVPYATAAHHFCRPGSPGWMMLFGSYSIYRHICELGGTVELSTFCGGGHEQAGTFFNRDQHQVSDFIFRVLRGQHFQSHFIFNRNVAAGIGQYPFCGD